MGTLVMKFGGSCIGTTPTLTQTLNIVLHERHQWERLVLVVSALDGVTDMLIEAVDQAHLGDQRGYRRIAATLRTRHMALVGHLPLEKNERAALETDIDRLLFEMLNLYQGIAQSKNEAEARSKYEATIGMGERLSSRIVAALLRQNGIPSVAIESTDLIITDDVVGSATPDLIQTQTRISQQLLPLLEHNIIPVVTGFIGATHSGRITTLGRGGSDYTASILGSCLSAQEVWIWSGVDGMMTADPQHVLSAQVIPRLSYEEVAEMAYFGARILHSRMIELLRQEQIPVRVKNIMRPRQAGTLIHHRSPHTPQIIKAVTSIAGFGVIAPLSGLKPTVVDIVEKVAAVTQPGQADAIAIARSSTDKAVYFLVTTAAGPTAPHTIQAALQELLNHDEETHTWRLQPVSIITVIGAYLRDVPGVTAGILQTMSGIHLLALMQGTSGCSLSFIVTPEQADETLHRIHQLIINSA